MHEIQATPSGGAGTPPGRSRLQKFIPILFDKHFKICNNRLRILERKKMKNYDYLMNHVDRAYGLIANADEVEWTDRGRWLRERALDSIGELFDYLDEEE